MKKYILLFSLLFALIVKAQVPNKMSYQTVVRNSNNQLINNQQVGIKISLLQGSATGNAVFTQIFTPTTNANGLATIVIGDTSATYSNINWASGGPFFIKTEVDPTGGTNYTIEATSELMSVPYAMVAGSVANIGRANVVITGDITDIEAEAKLSNEVTNITESITISQTTKLTTVDFSKIKFNLSLARLIVTNNLLLESINFKNVKHLSNNYILSPDIGISGNPKLTNIAFPDLMDCDGKIEIYAKAQKINFPNLEYASGGFSITNNDSSYTLVDLPKLKKVGGLGLQCPQLKNINLPLLEEVNSDFEFSNYKFLEKIILPSLKKVNGVIDFGNDSLLTQISLPGLVTYGDVQDYWSYRSQLSIYKDSSLTKVELPNLVRAHGYIGITECNKLTSIDLSGLKVTDNLSIKKDSSLLSINLPVLDTVLGLGITENNSILNINIPNVSVISLSNPISLAQKYPSFNITENPSLVNFTMPVISSANTKLEFDMSNNKLSSTAINNILSSLVQSNLNIPTSNYPRITINYQKPPAPPTGQGIIDKQILIAKGIYVATD